MLVHVVDGSEVDLDIRLKTINEELLAYNPLLSEVPQIVVINKIDLVKDKKRKYEIEIDIRNNKRKARFKSDIIPKLHGRHVSFIWRRARSTGKPTFSACPI